VEIVKILHCGEGGDVEQMARTLKQISRVYVCISQLNYTLTYILLGYYCSSLYAWYCLYVYTCFEPRKQL